MRNRLLWVLVAFTFWGGPRAEAIDCNTNCDRRCRVRLPFGGEVVEPACKVDCNAKKTVACAVQRPIPDPPGSPSTIPGTFNSVSLAACARDFDRFAQAVILDCGRFRTPGRDREILDWVTHILVNHGIVGERDFRNVEIRFCALRRGTAGIVPERNLVLLDDSYHPLRSDYDLDHLGLVGLGTLLTHEMVHVAQYRRYGTDEFKCRYVEELKRNGFRQDRAHPLEREAYDREDRVFRYLERELRHGLCTTFGGLSCEVSGAYLGDPCHCPDGFGREQKGLVGW